MISSPRAAFAIAAFVAALVTPGALADSTPVGTLPPGPVATTTAARGTLAAIAVARRKASTGLVWRPARPLNAAVLRQVGEADLGPTLVRVFRAVGRGRATVVLALTKGDGSPKAVAASRYRIIVT